MILPLTLPKHEDILLTALHWEPNRVPGGKDMNIHAPTKNYGPSKLLLSQLCTQLLTLSQNCHLFVHTSLCLQWLYFQISRVWLLLWISRFICLSIFWGSDLSQFSDRSKKNHWFSFNFFLPILRTGRKFASFVGVWAESENSASITSPHFL